MEAQLQIVALFAAGAAAQHPLVAGDAVVDVDDEVARGQPVQDVAGHDAAHGPGPPNPDGAEELAVGDQDEPVGTSGEAAVEAPTDERSGAGTGSLRDPVDRRGRHVLLGQQLGQAGRLIRCQDDSSTFVRPARDRLRQPRGPGRRQRRLSPAEKVAHRRSAAGRRGSLGFPGELQSPSSQEAALPLARTQVGLRPLLGQIVSGHELIAALLRLAPQEVGRVGDLGRLVEDEERPGGNVV